MGAWWVKKLWAQRPLEDLSYEELFDSFKTAPADVMIEFEHRLALMVLTMGLERARQEGLVGTAAEQRAEALTEEAFLAFEASFDKGSSRFGLARFADTLKGVVGAGAFEKNAVAFYTQLPLYTIADARQRTCVSLILARGMTDEAFDWVARQQHMTVQELEQVFAAGLVALEQARHDNFDPGELARLTEGYVQ